jgi:hypothetical protein
MSAIGLLVVDATQKNKCRIELYNYYVIIYKTEMNT